MLLLSLAVQPLIRRISEECHLLLNKWDIDDGTPISTIPEVTRALSILQERGHDIGFHMNVSKCRAYWPTTLQASLTSLTQQFPSQVSNDGGLSLLGAHWNR